MQGQTVAVIICPQFIGKEPTVNEYQDVPRATPDVRMYSIHVDLDWSGICAQFLPCSFHFLVSVACLKGQWSVLRGNVSTNGADSHVGPTLQYCGHRLFLRRRENTYMYLFFYQCSERDVGETQSLIWTDSCLGRKTAISLLTCSSGSLIIRIKTTHLT